VQRGRHLILGEQLWGHKVKMVYTGPTAPKGEIPTESGTISDWGKGGIGMKKKFNWKDKLTPANYAKKLFWFMRKSFFNQFPFMKGKK